MEGGVADTIRIIHKFKVLLRRLYPAGGARGSGGVEALEGGLSNDKRDTTPEGWLFLKLCDVWFEDESESELSARSWFVFKKICDH